MRDVSAFMFCPQFPHSIRDFKCTRCHQYVNRQPQFSKMFLRDGTVRSKTITKARAKRSCAHRPGYATDTQTLPASSAVRAVGGLLTSHFGEDY